MTRKGGKANKPRSKPAGGKQRSREIPALKLWDMLTLSDQTDNTGRLLLEDSAPEAAIARADRLGIRRETVHCNYADTPSRISGLMNESAYEALRRDTADILSGFAWLADKYLAMDPSRLSTVQALTDVSHLGITLPLVLMGRAEKPIARKGALPSYVASLFKASRGVFSAAADMMNKKGAGARVSPAEITAFADEEGHLRRPQTQRVCAAPTRLIQRTLAVMLTAEGADPDESGLADLVDFDRLWNFYSVESRLSDDLSEYGFVLNNLMGTGSVGDPEELFVAMVPTPGGIRPFGGYTEEILDRVNSAQANLNELLGRSRSAARITFKDLVRLL